MRLIFFGYQNIGFRSLTALIELASQFGDTIAAVVTHTDDPGENIWFPSVRELAGAHGIPVHEPRDPNAFGFVELLKGLAPDFLISCYYRYMLKQPLLDLPVRGALNLHGSLLPRYRGKCPINWVLVHGETETGLTLHYMEEKPDRGDIVAQQRVPIFPDDTALTLNLKLAAAAEALWNEIYAELRAGTAPRRPQDHSRASYFGGRGPEDGLINWQHSARQIHNLVRAVTKPYPGAFTQVQGKTFFIWAGRALGHDREISPAPQPGGIILDPAHPEHVLVQTGQGLYQITQGQFEGEPALAGEALATRLLGYHGHVLGYIQP